MNPIQALAVLVIRVLAAVVIVQYIGAMTVFAEILFFPGQEGYDTWNKYALLNAIFVFAIGVAAWIASPSLAKKFLPMTERNAMQIAIDADTLVMLGSFLIGAFYLVEHAPMLLTHLGALFIENSHQDPNANYELGRLRYHSVGVRQLISELLVVSAALWMALRPSHLAHIFSHLRRAGLSKEEKTNQE